MAKTMREVLDQLDADLMEMSIVESSRVLAVLSALRGPDRDFDGDEIVKEQTTGVIRDNALPRLANDWRLGARGHGHTLDEATKDAEANRELTGDHFAYHILYAARALLGRNLYTDEPMVP